MMSGMSREKPALDRARCMDQAWSLYESSGERIRNAGVMYPDSVVNQPILQMVLCAKGELSSSSWAASASVRDHETEDRWPLWFRRIAIERREKNIIMCRPSRKGCLRRWHGISRKKGEANAKSKWAVAKFRDRVETVRRQAFQDPKLRSAEIQNCGSPSQVPTAPDFDSGPWRTVVHSWWVSLVH